MMEDDDGATFQIPSDITEGSAIIEEGPRICPLCNSIVKLFFINFNEKVAMCENPECEFPFGYEDIQVVEVNHDYLVDAELMSIRGATGQLSPTASMTSTAAWAEIEKINHVYDSDDTQFDTRSISSKTSSNERNENLNKSKEAKNRQEKMLKDLQNINELTVELANDEDCPTKAEINNKKWIKNLMKIQMLKEDEINKLEIKEPALKIDINRSENNMSCINIELANQETPK